MRVLVLGSGGREHALAWAVSKSRVLKKLYIAPGNAGTAALGQNLAIPITQPLAVRDAVQQHNIDLVIVGPEAPLFAGVASVLSSSGCAVLGPSAAAAQIEASKSFAKDFMSKQGIPTAPYGVFESVADALRFAARRPGGLAVKADGPALGKGVFLCRGLDETRNALDAMVNQYMLGRAGHRVVLEDLLQGPEVSLFALSDGSRAWPLATARDYKRLKDNNLGVLTGGMGAFSPTPDISEAQLQSLYQSTMQAALAGLSQRGRAFRGVLYGGLMLSENGPRVLEFNCRFGDPEAQVILPRARFDWLSAFWKAATGQLPEALPSTPWSSQHAVAVVLCADGYPGRLTLGDPIEGLSAAAATGALIFHGGTLQEGSRTLTAGGRVLTVVGLADTLAAARDKAYAAAEHIQFRGKFCRSDIAK
jgi:phosphoribosylamine--glycine ligase